MPHRPNIMSTLLLGPTGATVQANYLFKFYEARLPGTTGGIESSNICCISMRLGHSGIQRPNSYPVPTITFLS